jgi:F-type H+-transporting ATPase subunit b
VSLSSLHTLSGIILTAASGESAQEPSALAMVTTTILGFLLAFWVLRKFAFGPLLTVIDERRDQIQSDLKKAEEARQQAVAEKAELDERLRNIENEARAKMVELVNEGKRVSASIQEEARKQADSMIEKAQRNIQFETEKARETLKKEIIGMTIQATEHLIRENLDDAKQRNLIANFISDIERN